MNIVDHYLYYIQNEQVGKVAATVGGAIGKGVVLGTKQSLLFGLLILPAIALSWRAARAAGSQAVRKCGGIKKSTPGFKTCVSREKIKAAQEILRISQTMISKCSKSKNPEICIEKLKLEIEKAKNIIELEKNKIKEVLDESIQEQLAAVTSIVVSMVVDKALFLSWRTAKAAFSSAARKCGVYSKGAAHDLCLSKIKLQALTQENAVYQKILSGCSKQKSPENCKKKMTEKIQKTQRDIQIQKDNITTYTNQLAAEKREKQMKEALKNQEKENR